MAQFHCRVMTEGGTILEEVFQAESKEELISSFFSRKYIPIEVQQVKQNPGNIVIGHKKLKLKSLVLFCRQMSTLLRSGVPLVRCFDIIASQTDDKLFKSILSQLSAAVQSGSVLSVAIAAQGDAFPPMLSRMVEVGEVTGDLSGIMERMALQYESDSRIRKKIRGAATYPIALCAIAFGACIFMLIAVVPRFVEIFESLNTELPLMTRILLTCSNFLTQQWYIAILVIPLLFVGLFKLYHTPKVTNWVDKKKLTARGIKIPMQKLMCAQFARTLHTLIACGVPIVQAMDYTNQNIDNTFANAALREIIVGLQKGKGISEQMSQFSIFPKLLVSMISIGEVSGNLEDMLSKSADYYDEELDSAISQLTSLLEPLMILVVGLMIGAIVMALYAPMFSVISAMSNSV